MAAWTRRGAITAGLCAVAQPASATPLTSLLGEGPDGILSVGAITRHGDGRLALAHCAGRKLTMPGVPTPFTLDDPFRVASVSKMIAATAFLRLVEAGRVGLDDDASGPLGFSLRHPAFPDRSITIRQLLSHTSSLRNGPNYPIPAGHALREAFTPTGGWFGPADKPPGAWFAYADVNYAVIAQIIERLTGTRFDHYMAATILGPLGLDAGYNWSGVSSAKRGRAASGQRWLNGGWKVQVDAAPTPVPTELPIGVNGFHFSPQGGLRLSLQDMDRLARMYATRQDAMLKTQMTPVWRFDPHRPNGETGEDGENNGVFGAYGLGVEIPGMAAGDGFFGSGSADWRGHLGDAYGWMTGLFWNLRTRATLVWAANGMRETGRPKGRRSALSPVEEALIDRGVAAIET